jgi:hypothetical protein
MRRALITTVAALTLFGLVAVVYVLARSLGPTVRAEAELPRVLLPVLSARQFVFVKHPQPAWTAKADLLFLRTAEGELRVFEISTVNGKHTMPDRVWWRPGHLCRKFEPDFERVEFRCNDPAANDWVQEKFRWSLGGKTLSPEAVEDMVVIHGRIEAGGYFVIGGKAEANPP